MWFASTIYLLRVWFEENFFAFLKNSKKKDENQLKVLSHYWLFCRNFEYTGHRELHKLTTINFCQIHFTTYFFCDLQAPVSLNPLAKGLWSIFSFVTYQKCRKKFWVISFEMQWVAIDFHDKIQLQFISSFKWFHPGLHNGNANIFFSKSDYYSWIASAILVAW